MPLVKIYALRGTTLPLSSLQRALCEVWGTKPITTKLMLSHVEDWTSVEGEQVYVDIRAKATPDRTREAVMENMERVQGVFAQHGFVANVRLETYEAGSYFHRPPAPKQ